MTKILEEPRHEAAVAPGDERRQPPILTIDSSSTSRAEFAVSAFDRAQKRLGDDASRLASGLRVRSSADDPSGYAVATRLRVASDAYDQGSRNVQDATNFLNVGTGALQTVVAILQRMHTLAAQANNDLLSTTERAMVQQEFASLGSEINAIGAQTKFNGQQVFPAIAVGIPSTAAIADPGFELPALPPYVYGSYTTSPSNPSAYPRTGSPWTFVGQSRVAAVGSRFDANGGTPPPPQGLQSLDVGTGEGVTQTISGFSSAYVYTFGYDLIERTFLATPSVSLQVTLDGVVIGTATTSNRASWAQYTTTPVRVASGTHVLGILGTNGHSMNIDAVTLSATLPQGVETEATFTVHDRAGEGATRSFTTPPVSLLGFGLAGLDLTQGAPGSTTTGPGGVEAAVSSALDIATRAQATLGAAAVMFASDFDDNALAAVNLTASSSRIRDLDVASATAATTRDRVLASAATAVFAQANAHMADVLTLFQNGTA